MDEPLRDPELTAPERSAFRALIDGEEVGEGTLTLRAEDDRTFVQEIEGRAFGRLTGSAVVRFRRKAGGLIAESQALDLRDRDRHVLTEEASFRDVQVPQMGGEIAGYPRPMVPAPALALALRTLPLAEKARFVPRVWLAAVVHWPLDVRVEKRETIEVPAGRFEAFRIRLRPSLVDVAQALDELSATVVPPVIAHVATEPAGRLLRLSFPTGPARTDPPGLLEATAL
ncbi:hypothetical protein [Patulibacter defluvii]|uniref:hypothetical protein n=1 Tax=Patulibacter defluvii TaxID=3095358 RepID=UPI002A764608|nr:hypothetical protein [Patulibacter sp. DM4]